LVPYEVRKIKRRGNGLSLHIGEWDSVFILLAELHYCYHRLLRRSVQGSVRYSAFGKNTFKGKVSLIRMVSGSEEKIT